MLILWLLGVYVVAWGILTDVTADEFWLKKKKKLQKLFFYNFFFSQAATHIYLFEV